MWVLLGKSLPQVNIMSTFCDRARCQKIKDINELRKEKRIFMTLFKGQ